jgi:uncharacterized protein (DUF433 family)
MATRQPLGWCPENGRTEADYNVVRDPATWGGVALVANTRIPVFMLESLFNETGNVHDVIQAYPRLTVADVHQVLAYARAFGDRVALDRAMHETAVDKALRG